MSFDDPNINKIFFQKYLCQKRIGKGSFGVVYSGINTITNEKIAIKTEKKSKGLNGTLEAETYRLVYLRGEGIPKIYCYGNNNTHNVLVQELLGRSLEDIFNSMHKKFTLKTVCVLGIEFIKRIRYVHSKFHIHRDIKPDNFMTGRDKNENKIYIIDFGLSKKYYSCTKNMHIKFCQGKSLIGTARYCGKNAHRGYEQGRRDDIESIGYVLMYFLLGHLPWQGIKCRHGEDQFEKIAEKKYTISFEELCKGQPDNFVKYFQHAEQLSFEDEPNYDYLIGLFQDTINTCCNDCFYDFDWKKNVCNYLSDEQKENLINSTKDQTQKSKDISLIVKKGEHSINDESFNLPKGKKIDLKKINKNNNGEDEEENYSDCIDSFGEDDKEKPIFHAPKGGKRRFCSTERVKNKTYFQENNNKEIKDEKIKNTDKKHHKHKSEIIKNSNNKDLNICQDDLNDNNIPTFNKIDYKEKQKSSKNINNINHNDKKENEYKILHKKNSISSVPKKGILRNKNNSNTNVTKNFKNLDLINKENFNNNNNINHNNQDNNNCTNNLNDNINNSKREMLHNNININNSNNQCRQDILKKSLTHKEQGERYLCDKINFHQNNISQIKDNDITMEENINNNKYLKDLYNDNNDKINNEEENKEPYKDNIKCACLIF